MAYVYQITNDVNGKIYVGKTEFSIEKRFKEHCKDAFRERNEKRPLYIAMRKYGIEHFHISLIEETDNPEERERYWIEIKRSFKKGYNATMGGDGKKYLDYDLIVTLYNEIHNQAEVARILGISTDSVHNVLMVEGVNILSSRQVNENYRSTIVKQYDLNGNLIAIYPSASKAAKKIKPFSNSRGIISHITDVCKGKRVTAYGFKWSY